MLLWFGMLCRNNITPSECVRGNYRVFTLGLDPVYTNLSWQEHLIRDYYSLLPIQSLISPIMSDSSQSSSRPLYGRIAYPNGFLPLASEAVLSTRGQSLQGLIRSRSSASLDVSSQKRHRPNFIDEEANDLQIGGRRTDSRGANESELARGAAPACVTPKMRSMRLIGSNNASYNWQVTCSSCCKIIVRLMPRLLSLGASISSLKKISRG